MKMYSEKSMPQGNAKKHNQGGMGMKGEMGYAHKPEMLKAVNYADMGKVRPMKQGDKGYDSKAWDYKY